MFESERNRRREYEDDEEDDGDMNSSFRSWTLSPRKSGSRAFPDNNEVREKREIKMREKGKTKLSLPGRLI